MKPIGRFALPVIASAFTFAVSSAQADTFRLRIATGHPPAVVYAGQMKDYFQPELKKRVESKTKHKIEWVEGYGGSIVKVYETLGGVRDGIIDIGGFCFCFEPANLPMHAFQVMHFRGYSQHCWQHAFRFVDAQLRTPRLVRIVAG